MTSTPSPAIAPDRFRVPGLDGIRALAVTTVVVFHLLPGTLIGGYLGVDIFFVVSGFLITTLLLRERAATGRISLRGFWTRRARRLLPALALVLLACCAAAFFIGGDVLVKLGSQVLGAVTFSSNWVFIAQGASYFDQTLPELFRNLWSLAVEEQFYIVWPLLLTLLLVRIPRWARLNLIGAVAVASAVWMGVAYSPVDPTRVYYGTDTHAFGLAIGAFLAVLLLGRGVGAAPGSPSGGMSSRPARWLLGLGGTLAIAALIALAVLMSGDFELVYRGGLVLVSVVSAVAIAALLVPGSWLARALDFAPIRWVGVRSYGLYLWHWPVFVLVSATYPAGPREGLDALIRAGIALAITVVAAALSYRFVEQPIRRHGFRATARAVLDSAPRSRRALGAAFAMVLMTALAGTSVAALVADPGQGEAETYIEAGQEAIEDGEPVAPPADEDAALDAVTTGDEITAIGDSVMLAAAPALQAEYPGIQIDATVSRSMYSAPEIVQAYESAGTLRPVVVLALGTNGPIDRNSLEQVRSIIGPTRELVVVNAQAPRGWIPGVNAELSSFAQVYRNVELANWHDAIQPYLHEMARDQVHFGPIGAGIFAGAVSDAVDRLAALPPLRDDSADLSLPTPF
jgi:peptidoglycan/LPS O-acetylase OafA/YrhL